MQAFIMLLFMSSFKYSAVLHIHVIPDSIYVGALATLSVSVKELQEDEYPEFPIINEESNLFTVSERILSNNTADYIIQFWEVGLISIPSFTVSINRHRHEIFNIQSDIIKISVFSNIYDTNSTLRSIKPMQELNIISVYNLFIYSLLFVIGMFISIYLWKSRKQRQNQHLIKGTYSKSIYKDTIHCMQSVELPKNINTQTTEEYYLQLSHICRTFIKNKYYIRATEMTSEELALYFNSIGIKQKLIHVWSQANQIADMSKYAGQIPPIDQFNRDKEGFIQIIKSFHKIEPQITR